MAATAVTTLTDVATAFSAGVSSSIGVGMGLTCVSVRFTTCSMVEETLTSIFSAVIGSDDDLLGELDRLSVAELSRDAAGSDGVRVEAVRFFSGFVLESLKVGVSSTEPTWSERVTDGVRVFR